MNDELADDRLQPPSGAASVRGAIRDRDGAPLPNAIVHAFDHMLTVDKPLGRPVRTDDHGRYCIEYHVGDCHPCGTGPALIVRAYGHDDQMLAESPIMYNPPAQAEIDLMIGGGTYRGPSEYEQIAATIGPCLDGFQLLRLIPEQLDYLTKRTGITAALLQLFVGAARLGEELHVPPEAVYGLTREGLPVSAPQLVVQSAATRRSALQKALADNLVPLRTAEQLDAIERAFQAAAVHFAMNPPDASATASPGAVLAVSGLSTQLQQKFLAQYTAHDGPIAAFWTALRKDPELGPAVPKIQLSIQLASVARGHLPLVKSLQARAGSLRDLAKLTDRDWSALVAESGTPADAPGRTDAEKAANYVQTLRRTMDVLIPSAVVAEQVQHDPVVGTPEVRAFFAKNSRFDFANDHVDRVLAATSAVADGDREKLAAQLKRIQRVFRLTPRWTDIAYLLANGLDSAQRVVQMGRGPFLAAHGSALGGPGRAGEIFDRARQITATAALLFARFAPQMNAATPASIGSASGNGR